MFHYWGELCNGSVTPEQLQYGILEKLVTFIRLSGFLTLSRASRFLICKNNQFYIYFVVERKPVFTKSDMKESMLFKCWTTWDPGNQLTPLTSPNSGFSRKGTNDLSARKWQVTKLPPIGVPTRYSSTWGRFLVPLPLSELHRDHSIQLRPSPTSNFFASNSCQKLRRTVNRSTFTIKKSTPGERTRSSPKPSSSWVKKNKREIWHALLLSIDI